MFYLENDDGLLWSKENGIVDDLDFADGFPNEESALLRAENLDGNWSVYEDISE